MRQRFSLIAVAAAAMLAAALPVAAIFNGQPAANVLGQANFTTATSDTNQQGFKAQAGVFYDSTGQRLFVSEEQNNRLLTFDVAAVTDNENATDVLGQDNFGVGAAGSSASRMNEPQDVLFDSATNRLYVADSNNNRVLAYDTSAGAAWTSRTSAADNNWSSVTYGNGLFVAVAYTGTGNRVMTSPDGVTWTIRTSAADNFWTAVTYGNGQFVAVGNTGTGSRIMRSTDGISWTTVGGAADNSWTSVASDGNGTFVAVANTGTNNRVVRSTDNGQTWTTLVGVAQDRDWRAVTYGNGRFVAVSSGTDVMTSTDGATWTPRTAAANSSWSALTYGNGQFVAVSSGANVMTSPDGITWTLRTAAASNTWFSVTYGNGLFVAVATLGTNTQVMTSTDGATWTLRNSPSLEWNGVTYGNGMFVAVAATGTGNRAMSSGAAPLVLGQPDLTTVSAGTTQAKMSYPMGLALDGSTLFVSEFNNRRVVTFDVTSITNGENAVNVFGQPDFVTSGPNSQNAGAGCTTPFNACGFASPQRITVDAANDRLFVPDNGNHRVLVFNYTAITNHEAAVNVLGAPDFTTSVAGTTTQSRVNSPRGATYDAANNRLFVTESGNHRVVTFDVAAITDGEAAINVIGQPDFTTGTSGTTLAKLSNPSDAAYDAANNRLFVADGLNNRVMAFDLAVSGGGGGSSCASPSVTVADPNGGESYAHGSTQLALWSSSGCNVTGVKVTLSTDGGTTYPTTIAPAAHAPSGYLNWTVPDIDTTKARMKLELLGQGGVVLATDTSDADFTIVGTPPPPAPPAPSPAPPAPPEESPAPTPSSQPDPSSPSYSISDDLGLPEEHNPLADFCRANRLIKLPSDNNPLTQVDSAVYYCGSNGKRYVFASSKLFATWYSNFSGIVVVSAEQLATLPIGGNVTYKPGVKMVKIVSDPKTYVVAPGSVLRHVPDESTARALYGLQWNQFIDDVDPSLFASYSIGDPIPAQ